MSSPASIRITVSCVCSPVNRTVRKFVLSSVARSTSATQPSISCLRLSLSPARLAQQERLQRSVGGPRAEIVSEQPVAGLDLVLARAGGVLVPEGFLDVGVAEPGERDRAREICGLLLGSDTALPERKPRAVWMDRPAELGEPDRLRAVAVASHQVVDSRCLREQPPVAAC